MSAAWTQELKAERAAFFAASAGAASVQFKPVCLLKRSERVVSMSFEDIISAVQLKPEIWLSSHPLYKHRIVGKKAWNEIALQLGIAENALKKRWKHLKDQYRKELKKTTNFKSEMGARCDTSSWQYFNSMSFIRDELIPSKTSGNLEYSDKNTSNSEQNTNDSFEEEIEDTTTVEAELQTTEEHSVASDHSATSSTPLGATRKRNASSQREDMLSLEKKKIQLMEARIKASEADAELKKDEDYLYLMSILPSMKRLNPLQKLQLRGKINEWLINEITRSEYVSTYYNQPTEAGPSSLQHTDTTYYTNI